MKKSLTPLGETEMEVLHHVWELGEATVKDVQQRILESREVAYTTIMTVMKNLADKGYLQYRKDGVTYVYSPAQEPDNVRFNLVSDLVKKVFKGSPMELVQTLVKSEELSDEERDEIRKMIDKMED
ncbi:MAG: BlaI/MecI/CopY family transcriptional regulator [Balneolaceae bacterium]|nr:BlaI/MecI/CopY family transcriptional regulator [Balneolaceae bacterium]